MKLAKQALARDDKDPTAYFAAGRIHMMRGRHDNSIASLETAIDLNPSFAQAYHGLVDSTLLAERIRRLRRAASEIEFQGEDQVASKFRQPVIVTPCSLDSRDRDGARVQKRR